MPPVPANFSFKYVMWFIWCNAVTILTTIQGVLAAITLDPTTIDHNVYHWIVISNAVLVVVLAQITRNKPSATDDAAAKSGDNK
jgi:hypothetical protein